MLLAPASILFMLGQAYEKTTAANNKADAMTDALKKIVATGEAHNTLLQWSIIIVIFLPIAAGMFIFGKYCFAGEYNKLPKSSIDL